MDKDKLAAKAAELTEELVGLQMGEWMIWEDRADGSEGLTEDAQDLFNEIQAIVLHHLNK
jgi:hypothetical protein|tara:strand:- start:45 stop:224 length:180 start_codon:yes stop_codon:yes gene_type:complete